MTSKVIQPGDIREVAVIGLGLMGSGIAELIARSGRSVDAVEINQGFLDQGMVRVRASLDRAVSRGRLADTARDEILARIRPTDDVATGVADADLVIEAIPERIEFKKTLFAQLDQACRADAILATNTSSLSVTEIARGTQDPARVAGLHFFNPAPVMKLVEVISTVLTSPETAETLPMGPLTLLDLIGLDTCLAILETLQDEFGGTRYVHAPLLRKRCDARLFGRKSGRVAADPRHRVLYAALAAGHPADVVGVYFTEAGNGKPGLAELVLPDVTAAATAATAAALAARIGLTAVISRDRPGFLIEALAYAQFNDAVRMFQDGYASPADIDTAMMLGCGYPRGSLQMLDEAGAAHVVSVLDAMHAATGDPAFTPVPLLAEYATAGSRFRAGARG
jgi:3-hydroxybutyryl-CoA dehydrogenase